MMLPHPQVFDIILVMNENELEQKIRDELICQLDNCYDETVRDLHVNNIMKLVRDLRNTSWRTGRKFGEEHAFD